MSNWIAIYKLFIFKISFLDGLKVEKTVSLFGDSLELLLLEFFSKSICLVVVCENLCQQRLDVS
jgi:hypothetical protein